MVLYAFSIGKFIIDKLTSFYRKNYCSPHNKSVGFDNVLVKFIVDRYSGYSLAKVSNFWNA